MENFESLLKIKTESLLSNLSEPPPANLRESIFYTLYNPGKRIRPKLCLQVSEMLMVPKSAAYSIALALEYFHCFTLIHDDLPCLDNDDFRRGKPSNHKVFGENLALLAGDSLSLLAVEILLEAHSSIPSENFIRGLKRFLSLTGARGVIGGQAQELLIDSNSSIQSLIKMQEAKTSALFEAAILIPADFVGLSENDKPFQILRDFSKTYGWCFQVLDDLLDSEQDQKKIFINVLHYLKKPEVLKECKSRMNSSIESLINHWGKKSNKLVESANQLIVQINQFEQTERLS